MRLILMGFVALLAFPAACVVPNVSQIGEGQSPPVMAADADAGALLVRAYPDYCNLRSHGAGIPPIMATLTYSCAGSVAISDDGSTLFLPEDGKIRVVSLSGSEELMTFDGTPNTQLFAREYQRARIGGRYIASTYTAIDMRTGAVLRIPQPAAGPAPVFRENSRTPEGIATLQAPRPPGPAVGVRFPPSQSVIVPSVDGSDILIETAQNTVPYSDPDPHPRIHMRLPDLQAAPPPGPAPSALASLVELRDYTRPSAQFNEPYTLLYKGFGPGYGHPFLYAQDGSIALWGLYSGKSSSDLGFGVFRHGATEPLWTMMFNGAPPTVSISDDNAEITVRDHFDFAKSQGREPMVRTYNALTGALIREIPVASLPPAFLQPVPSPRQALPPALEPHRYTYPAIIQYTDYIAKFGVLVSLETTQPDNGAQLVVREGKTGAIIWQKQLESRIVSGRSRQAAFAAAESAPRIAILSTDGKLRVFDYGAALTR